MSTNWIDNEQRVILHLDLDCFYCQVDMVRLNLDPDRPMAVLQWTSFVAVNYAARAANVNRFLTFKEGLAICPELTFVHVPTFSIDDPPGQLRYYDMMDGKTVYCPDRWKCKASLQPYREASMAIFRLIQQKLCEMVKRLQGDIKDSHNNTITNRLNTPEDYFILEKASVDEVYLDVTSLVDLHLSNTIISPLQLELQQLDWTGLGNPPVQLTNNPSENIHSLSDQRINIGSRIALEIREAIKNVLKYTVSAGIAHNKTLAKLASARFKPNAQTYVLSRHVLPWMETIPFRKIRFLGGKLGNNFTEGETERNSDIPTLGEPAIPESEEEEKKVMMASDFWGFSVEELAKKVEGSLETAKWVYDLVRGIDSSPVNPRFLVKSFLAAKTFGQDEHPTRNISKNLTNWEILKKWLFLLVGEIGQRVLEDNELNQRWPISLIITWNKPFKKGKSKVMDFILQHGDIPHRNSIMVEAIINMFKTQQGQSSLKDKSNNTKNGEFSIFPISRVSVGVSKFKPYLITGKKGLKKQLYGSLEKFLTSEPLGEKEFISPKMELITVEVKNKQIKGGIDRFLTTGTNDIEFSSPSNSGINEVKMKDNETKSGIGRFLTNTSNSFNEEKIKIRGYNPTHGMKPKVNGVMARFLSNSEIEEKLDKTSIYKEENNDFEIKIQKMNNKSKLESKDKKGILSFLNKTSPEMTKTEEIDLTHSSLSNDQKPLKKDIRTFFYTNSPNNSIITQVEVEDDKWCCPQCNKRIRNNGKNIQEHKDFHFALSLMNN